LQPQISQNWTLFKFWSAEEKNLVNFQRIIELFTQKIVTKLSKIWVRDPGVKKAPDPGFGSATLVFILPVKQQEFLISTVTTDEITNSMVRRLCFKHRLNMELDLQSLFGLYSLAETPQLPPKDTPPLSPRIWAHIRGRYRSAKIDDVSL
jgi:hypothetical protein